MRKNKTRKPNLHPIRPSNEPETPFDNPVAVEDPPETEAPAEPAGEAAAQPRPAFKRRDPTGKQMTFFDRVAGIAREDWGTRAKIKIYRLDPIIDRTRGSEYKFVQIYHVPVDEDKIKVDHGSGRYRLYLNMKNAGDKNEKEIDVIEIDILDPKFPPNIPAGEWVDDPRNKKWAWARPAGAPGGPPAPEPPPSPAAVAASAANQFLEGVKIAGEIRKQVKDESPAPQPAADQSTSLAGTLQLVTTIMGMKADNPMNEVYRDEMKALREELAEERRENRKLMLENRNPQNGNKGFGSLKEVLGEVKEFLPTIKDLLPQVAETARAGRTNWLDLAKEAAPTFLDYAGKIALAFAQRAPMPPQQPMTLAQQLAPPAANGNGQPPAANGQPQQAPQQPQAEPPAFVRFISQPIVFNAFRRYFDGFKADDGQTGADFSQWAFDADGGEALKSARALGSANIMALLKGSPAWLLFSADEAKLTEFIDAALAWAPPAEEPDSPEDDDDENDSIDLTRKGV